MAAIKYHCDGRVKKNNRGMRHLLVVERRNKIYVTLHIQTLKARKFATY